MIGVCVRMNWFDVFPVLSLVFINLLYLAYGIHVIYTRVIPTDNTIMPVPTNITQTDQTTRTITVSWMVIRNALEEASPH